MINKTKMLTLFVILLNAATVAGYVLASKPVTDPVFDPISDQCTPYIDPSLEIKTLDWAREQALGYLNIAPFWGWTDTDVTPQYMLGTSSHLYQSGDISVKVTSYLNPSADFFVDVDYQGQSWSLRVSQTGECTLIN
jgi:hypothetical protein